MILNGVNVDEYLIDSKVTISDLDSDSSTRNVRGEMMRDRIAVKRKIELSFAPLTDTQIQTILKAVSGVFFTATFQDPELGQISKTMYAGDRGSGLTYNKGFWKGLKFNVIER